MSNNESITMTEEWCSTLANVSFTTGMQTLMWSNERINNDLILRAVNRDKPFLLVVALLHKFIAFVDDGHELVQ